MTDNKSKLFPADRFRKSHREGRSVSIAAIKYRSAKTRRQVRVRQHFNSSSRGNPNLTRFIDNPNSNFIIANISARVNISISARAHRSVETIHQSCDRATCPVRIIILQFQQTQNISIQTRKRRHQLFRLAVKLASRIRPPRTQSRKIIENVKTHNLEVAPHILRRTRTNINVTKSRRNRRHQPIILIPKSVATSSKMHHPRQVSYSIAHPQRVRRSQTAIGIDNRIGILSSFSVVENNSATSDILQMSVISRHIWGIVFGKLSQSSALRKLNFAVAV